MIDDGLGSTTKRPSFHRSPLWLTININSLYLFPCFGVSPGAGAILSVRDVRVGSVALGVGPFVGSVQSVTCS
jgi:4-amino-4-deoxy-L-arabinose transferase-like glycosyltransferase